MRGTIEGLATRCPLGRLLPTLYQDDAFTQRFTAALDEVLAPVLWVLDDLDAYVDPRLAPPDFLDWLAGWLGVELHQTWTEERRAAMVAAAPDLYRWRGTARAISRLVEIHTGVVPDLEESGGVAWSPKPGGKPPGDDDAWLIVRITVPNPEAVDRVRLERALWAAKPAEITLHVEVTKA